MATPHYRVGLNHVGSYQVSGRPWLSGSTLLSDPSGSIRFSFESVSKRVIVRTNDTVDVRVHFAPYTASFGYENGAYDNGNYVTLVGPGELEFGVKCKEIFVSAPAGSPSDSVEVYAELTGIPAERMFSLDGLSGVTS